MALFQKNPYDTGESKPLYTLGLGRTVLIVGLGNPGKKYDGTRHNIGFECLDALAKSLSTSKWVTKKDLKCQLAIGNSGDTRVILCKPTTFMNNSGQAVAAVINFYKISLGDLFVVHDELDIDFGQIRTRLGGSGAGHNGIKSIIDNIGENFGRVRIGVGPRPSQVDGKDYVLGKFTKEEQSKMGDLTREVTALLAELIVSGQLQGETRSFLY